MDAVDDLVASGIDRIAVMTTNDRHVNTAWRQGIDSTRASNDSSDPLCTITFCLSVESGVGATVSVEFAVGLQVARI